MSVATKLGGNVGGTVGVSGSEKQWFKFYPSKTPHEINPEAFRNLAELIEQSCRKFAARPSFTNFGCTYNFGEIEEKSRHFATYLQGLGLRKGDRLAIQMPNLLQYPIALFGALRAGLTVVNTNPLYTAREMEFQFNDSGIKAVVICANFAGHLEEILPRTSIQHVVVTEIGDLLPAPKRWIVNAVLKYVKRMVPRFHLPKAVPFRKALAEGARHDFKAVEIAPQDLAFIQYTGGTTGTSKGAMLTHRNVIANSEQVCAMLYESFEEGKEICLTPLPLYHIFSLSVNCIGFFKYGTRNILITNPRDIGGMLKDLRGVRFTLMTGVNTLFNGMMNHPDFTKLDFSGLKFSVAGAMALQKPVYERWKELTGTDILEGYGLTEASPVISCNPPTDKIRVGTIGVPLSSTDVELRDEQGKKVAHGEEGELYIKGPQVMKGYWKRPEETAAVIGTDGWLRTGDIAKYSGDGFFQIVDRKKDMITVSGFKVYPNEVEEVLAMHPKILEAGVIGIPDGHSGEAVKAFIVKRDPSLTEAEVLEHSKKNLTNYKVPKRIEFIQSLPKTPVGKILRRELR